jgi:hypothetical protein
MRILLLVLGLALVGSPGMAPAPASAAIHGYPPCGTTGRAFCEPAAASRWTLVGQRFLRGYNQPQAEVPADEPGWRGQRGFGARAFERGCRAAQRGLSQAELGPRLPRFWEGWNSCSAPGAAAPIPAAPPIALPPAANLAPPPREPRAQVQPDPDSSAYQQGVADRGAWENWFNGLTGDYRAGAEWWSGQRSKPKPGSCYGSNVQEWTDGCVAAQQRLATADIRRKTEPQFWLGWNSYTPSAPPPMKTLSSSSEDGSAIDASRANARGESLEAHGAATATASIAPPATPPPMQPAAPPPVAADQEASGPVLYTFSGNGNRTTRPFEVKDPWELQWDTNGQIAIWVQDRVGKPARPDHIGGTTPGSSYMPISGTFELDIDSDSDWTIRVVAVPQSGTAAPPPVPQPTESPRSPPPPIPQAAVAQTPVPTAEPDRSPAETLLSIVKDYAGRYNSAPNEMAQGALRPARARAICRALPDRAATDWVGSIERLSSNNEGKGVLSVRISDSVTVRTMNNAFSDIEYNTLIPVGSRLQQEAMALHEGQRVVFSGSFVPNDDDCIMETSLTVSGDMTEPAGCCREFG